MSGIGLAVAIVVIHRARVRALRRIGTVGRSHPADPQPQRSGWYEHVHPITALVAVWAVLTYVSLFANSSFINRNVGLAVGGAVAIALIVAAQVSHRRVRNSGEK
jgi:hypothetical protein